ncbi:MAG: 50S ribosomal protein L9 [Deltaproteobacteria bacterium CG2_30_63_29]|nr:MAG: 50S ribosomal protein L9 [Deltaproteobacteria bacterium CG2_30_63_29]PJB37088.1 MAG: 50S ribosomal protein L9 [Deltaproteobacteria bacterium CG_4_9_14_3_um_filter_63_12]
MQVILTEDVPHVGDMGDIVKVSDGFGRNFLIPQKLALPAVGGRIKYFQHEKTRIARQKEQLRQKALEVVGGLRGVSVTIPRQVGEDDKLYGSVTNRDVQVALAAAGFDMDRRKILLDQPIKELGIFSVAIKLHSEVKAHVRVWVTAL